MANTCMWSSLPHCPWCGRILPSIMQSNSLSPAHIHSLLYPSTHSLIYQIFIDYLLYARYAWKSLGRVQLFATPWHSPGQNTGVGLPCPPPGNLPNPGIEPRSLALQVDSLPSEPPGKPLRLPPWWNWVVFYICKFPPNFSVNGIGVQKKNTS